MIELKEFDMQTMSIDELTDVVRKAYSRWKKHNQLFVGTHQTSEITKQRIQGCTCMVAMDGDRIIGTIKYNICVNNGKRADLFSYEPRSVWWANTKAWFKGKTSMYVGQFAVLPEYAGTQASRMLSQYCVKKAYELKVSEMLLDTSENARSLQRLYQSEGFIKVHYYANRYTNFNSFVMAKPIMRKPYNKLKAKLSLLWDRFNILTIHKNGKGKKVVVNKQ